jgi:predicted enzyme related to lactoylglutathione lyase
MTDFNSAKNRIVWADIPVRDLDRAAAFYEAVLGAKVHLEQFGDYRFGVIDHQDGNGGCLVPAEGPITGGGPLVYLNANGRLKQAVAAITERGGTIVEQPHSIGPHGFRALFDDTEGNRLALHSNADD